MLAEMPATLFDEWVAYWNLEPFGPIQEDLRAGHVAAAATNPYLKKGAAPVGPGDFFPSVKAALRREEPQSVEEQIEAAKAWTLALGGKVQ